MEQTLSLILLFQYFDQERCKIFVFCKLEKSLTRSFKKFLWKRKNELPVSQTALPCQLCSAPGWNKICLKKTQFKEKQNFFCHFCSTPMVFPPVLLKWKKDYLWAVTSRMSVCGTAWVNSIEVRRTSYSWKIRGLFFFTKKDFLNLTVCTNLANADRSFIHCISQALWTKHFYLFN